MIQPSSFLRRALLADAVFSGISALALTFGAGAFAKLLNLPEALLLETGLFLIAYAAFVGWLGTRQSTLKALVLLVIVGNAAWTLASIALLFSGAVSPNLLGEIAVVAQAKESLLRQRPASISCTTTQPDVVSFAPREVDEVCPGLPGLLQRKPGSYPNPQPDLFVQLNTTAAIIPTNVSASPITSIGTRLLPEKGFADTCWRANR